MKIIETQKNVIIATVGFTAYDVGIIREALAALPGHAPGTTLYNQFTALAKELGVQID